MRTIDDMTTRATGTACTNPTHDHTTMVDRDGYELDEPIPMRCNHDGRPAHYDTTIEDYVHDDQTSGCFLIAPGDNSNPCRATQTREPR